MNFREFLLTEAKGKKVSVPKFKTGNEMRSWLKELAPDDSTDVDVVDPQTGEVYLEVGNTKRKDAKGASARTGKTLQDIKDRAKEKFDGRSYPPYLPKFSKGDPGEFSGYVREFEDFYEVIEKDLASEVEDVEQMRKAEYDVEVEYPAEISKKDGGNLSNEDISNINSYLNFRQYTLPKGLKIEAVRDSKKTISIFISFI